MRTPSRQPNIPLRILFVGIIFFNLLAAMVPQNSALAIWGPGKPQNLANSTAANPSTLGPTATTTTSPNSDPAALAAAQQKVRANLGKFPLAFESNQNQTDVGVKYLARGQGYVIFLTGDKTVLKLQKPRPKSASSLSCDSPSDSGCGTSPGGGGGVLVVDLVGNRPTTSVDGLEQQNSQSHYFTGKNSQNWQNTVSNYGKVAYRGIYPGIDQLFYGDQRQLTYDFVVAPGANPSQIQFRFQGADQVTLTPEGDLKIQLGEAELIQKAPVIYQETNGQKQLVSGGYRELGLRRFGFQVGAYDSSLPLTIDPSLDYSTYLGGGSSAAGDFATDLTLDSSGNVYVVGYTDSLSFPSTPGVYQAGFAGGTSDAFIAKLNPTATSVAFFSYLGGGGEDIGKGITLDGSGNIYVVGNTNSIV